MSNAVPEIEVSVDGPRNVVMTVNIEANTSDFTDQKIVDITTLSPTNPPTNLVRVDEIQYAVEDGWTVILNWEGTPNSTLVTLDGRGMFPVGPNFGGIQNDATTPTGNILMSTTGYSSGTMVATLILHLVKQTSP
jgi:hypothetical protein